ncbi:MAG: Gfo/Idh/MocA family protein [Ardenticatenaceae bacterium]
MGKIRFALVGCGAITKKHFVSIQRLDEAEIVAVCDLNPTAARRVGEEYNLPFYTDCSEMAEKEEFDIISILTPSGTHARLILELVKYGRHFLVEKPLALRIEDADRVIRACDAHGSKLFVVQQNRYNLPIRKLKQALVAGRFGKLVMGTVRVRWARRQSYYDAKSWRGTWAQDGGVLTNQASHHIDMLLWLLGDVESVMAMSATRLVDIEAEDTGVAILRFSNGALGIIEATTATRPTDLEGSISVLGEKGAVEIGGFYMNELKTWQFEETQPEDERVFNESGKNPELWAWNHTEYLKGVIESLQQGTRGLVDGLEGRKSLELINAIYESVETGQTVSLRFRPRFCRLGLES